MLDFLNSANFIYNYCQQDWQFKKNANTLSTQSCRLVERAKEQLYFEWSEWKTNRIGKANRKGKIILKLQDSFCILETKYSL